MIRILKKIFVRPIRQIIEISIPAYALVIFVFVSGTGGLLYDIAYLASAYAVAITVVGTPRIARRVYYKILHNPLTQRVMEVSWIRRFMEDVTFHTEISLYQGLLMNILYIVLKIWSGIHYRSLWFWSLAVYYVLLIVVRCLLLRHVNHNTVGQNLPEELQRYRSCAVILLIMNQALAVIVMLIVYQNRSYDYPGLLIYAMAVYSVYAVTVAIINLIKFYQIGSPILWAAKAINLVAALVSVLSLETAMIARFGDPEDALLRRLLTGLTGWAMCIFILGLAMYMLVRSDQEMEKLGCRPEPEEPEDLGHPWKARIRRVIRILRF